MIAPNRSPPLFPSRFLQIALLRILKHNYLNQIRNSYSDFSPCSLERFRIFLAGDGQIVVDKNKKFNFEKGEWTRPEASLKV